jgi:hypothetical protein
VILLRGGDFLLRDQCGHLLNMVIAARAGQGQADGTLGDPRCRGPMHLPDMAGLAVALADGGRRPAAFADIPFAGPCLQRSTICGP